MSRLFAIVLAGILAFSMNSFAETRQFSEDQIEQFTQQLEATRQRLNLIKEQKEAMKPILKENAEKRLAIFKSYGVDKGQLELSFSQKRSLVKELRTLKEETNDKVSKILSEVQMEEYEKIQKENRARLREQIRKK